MTDYSKIYMFLSSRENWVNEADTDKKDGIITKKEFRTYMLNNESEWNGESTVDANSIINEFWDGADYARKGLCAGSKTVRNQNALDKNEQKKLAKKIQVYEEFEEFKKNNVYDVPKGINDTVRWVNTVINDLAYYVEKYIEKPTNKSLTEELLGVVDFIKNQTTADMFTQDHLDEALKNFADVVPNYRGGGQLQSILDTFIYGLENDADYNAAEDKTAYIKQSVQDIIDAYISTATAEGASSEQLDILAKYNYVVEDKGENTELNELQSAVVESKLRSALSAVKEETDYAAYSNIYDNAVNNYVERILSGAKFKDFEELGNTQYADFTGEKEYQDATNQVEAIKYLSGTTLEDAINETYDEKVADIFINETEKVTIVNDLKNTILEKVKNGELLTPEGKIDEEAIKKLVISEIGVNLAEFYTGNLSGVSLSDLSAMYDKLETAALSEPDTQKQLKALISAAMKYCKAVSGGQKPAILATAVAEVFGGNYTTLLQKMTASEIEEVMEKVIEKVTSIGDANTFVGKLPSAAWGNLPTSTICIKSGEQKSYNLANEVVIDGKTITAESGRLGYTSSSGVAVDSNGKVTVSESAVGTAKVTIWIDGIEIGSKTFTVTTPQSAATIISKATKTSNVVSNSTFLDQETRNAGGIYGSDTFNKDKSKAYKIESTSFKSLYENDSCFTVLGYADWDGYNTWGQEACSTTSQAWAERIVEQGLKDVGAQIVTVLASAGLNESILTNAMNKVANRYALTLSNSSKSNISGLNDKGDTNEQGLMTNHKRVDNADDNKEIFEYMRKSRSQNAHKVVHCFDQGGGQDSNVFAIYFKDFVDDIIAEYYEQGGT